MCRHMGSKQLKREWQTLPEILPFFAKIGDPGSEI
jgi:hypothetical protein